MGLIYNGILYNELSELESAIVELTDYQKQCLRNDFNGIPNQPIVNLVPFAVTTRQMHKALALTNKLTTIQAFISSLPEPNKTLVSIEFYQSNEFQRTNATLNQMAALMGMTNEEIDQLFIYASTL